MSTDGVSRKVAGALTSRIRFVAGHDIGDTGFICSDSWCGLRECAAAERRSASKSAACMLTHLSLPVDVQFQDYIAANSLTSQRYSLQPAAVSARPQPGSHVPEADPRSLHRPCAWPLRGWEDFTNNVCCCAGCLARRSSRRRLSVLTSRKLIVMKSIGQYHTCSATIVTLPPPPPPLAASVSVASTTAVIATMASSRL